MKILITFFILLFTISHSTFSQSMSINTDGSTANSSAILDVKSTLKGILIPRMSRTERNAISTPATGLTIFQNLPDSVGLYYFNGTAWTWLLSNSNVDSLAWRTGGNTATNDASNFIGTKDNVPLNLRVNNQKAGRIDNTLANTFYGYQAGNANTTGFYNTATGTQALFSNTGGSWNVATGTQALFSNTVGSDNVATGILSLNNNTSGGDNTATGNYTLRNNTTGSFNTATGWNALVGNTTGYENTAIGGSALGNNTVGNYNTATGRFALGVNTTGRSNTANGYSALPNNSIGNFNTAFGTSALTSNITGSLNVALGVDANVSSGALTNATVIGANAVVNASNKIRLGSSTVTVIEGQVAYTFPSDGRFKTNISDSDVKGLDFINRLRPVVYNFDTKKFEGFLTKDMPDSLRQRYMKIDFTASTVIRQSGFIAQEVEKAAAASGYNFNGVHKPDNDNDHYSLAYSQFVVPLVKGMQEQQQMINKLQQANDSQQQQIDALKKQVEQLVKLKNQ